jgi:YYY domain-containing protein
MTPENPRAVMPAQPSPGTVRSDVSISDPRSLSQPNESLPSTETPLPPAAHTQSARQTQAAALVIVILLGILAVGAFFRFSGLNWDSGSHLHPDERFLTDVGSLLSGVDNPLDYLRTSRSTLNPYNVGKDFYVYGNFPMTVTRYSAEWLTGLCEFITDLAGEPPSFCGYRFTAYDGIHFVGRFLSGLVDLISVFFTFLIGRRLYNVWAGLLAALLLALAVMPIQQSHFFTMDNWAATFTTVALYAAVRAASLGDIEPRWRLRWWGLFGVALGLAAASRVNIAPLAVVINISAVIWLARRGHTWRTIQCPRAGGDLQRIIVSIALAGLLTVLTFRLAQPYAFTDAEMVRQQALIESGREPSAFTVALKSIIGLNPQFLANMSAIQGQQSPEAAAPPALQWTDRPAILFPLTNMILYGMGLTAGLFAWFAVLWALWRMFDRTARWRNYPEWMVHAIPVSWTLLYFLFMGTRWVKSVRYFLPIYPALFILAGWGLVYLWQRARQRDTAARRGNAQAAVIGLAAVIVIPSFLWAVVFTQIYREPMTRIAASSWIFDNIPSGATLLYDTFDGQPREMNLPLKGMLFEHLGVPLYLEFQLPENGTIRGVRFNYLSDAAENPPGGGNHSLRVQLNQAPVVEQVLQLNEDRQAVVVDLPQSTVSAATPLRLTIEGGPGDPIRAGTSLLVNEVWDDLLPASVDGRNAYGAFYTEVTGGQRPVVHPDSPEKLEEIVAWLDEADYIPISSQRAMWHLPRLPYTFPLMIRYYEALFSGELGFDLVAQFHGNMRLGPLYISDTTGQISWGKPPSVGWPPPGDLAAEEAFSVYDHPPVWIFAKTDRYSRENTRRVFESIDTRDATFMNPLQATIAKGGMMLSVEEQAAQRAGGTFSEVFDIDGPLARNPWLAAVVWVVALVLIGWVAFPIAFIALGGLPDRGYALARVLGLLLLSYFPWLLAGLKILPHTRETIALVLLGIGATSTIILIRRRREIFTFLRRNAGYIVLVEVLGLALFLLMMGVRLGNPDVWDVIWGGEKPMDLSYLTAVLKSTTMPPYDPWHAGGYINYYYFGFVFVGALTKLLGIMPAIAYNLILPMLFSMTGLAVFSLAYNLVKARQRGTGVKQETEVARPFFRQLAHEIRSRAAVAGFIAVALALLLGNLAQVGVITNAWHAAGTPTLEDIPVVGRLARTLDGGVKVLGGQPAPIYPGDWFWTASRAINADPGEVQPITEFPFFTFLYGDLHAHMISFPITILALGWAISLALAAGFFKGRWPTISEVILISLVGSIAIGSLRATNTWDWPTYMLLAALAIVYFVIRTDNAFDLRTVGKSLFLIVMLFGLSSLAFWPYSSNYGQGYSSVSFWQGSYTRAWNYLLVHGMFLFFVFTHVIREFRDWAATWTEEGKRSLEPVAGLLLLALGTFVVLNAVLLWRGYWVAPIALPLIVLTGLLALRPGLETPRRIVLVLMSAALGLTLMVEIIVLDGDIGRMNTVFKFYLQVWLMLSIASGVAAVWAWPAIRQSSRVKLVWQGVLSVLVFAALLYPLLATPAKWNIRMNKDAPNTLDGAAFMPYVEYGDTDYAGQSRLIRLAEDHAAIQWLQRNIQGSPVIMEAHGSNPYRSIAGRIAMYTGLPTVIGWDWHQRQQRAVAPGNVVTNRIQDVNSFYNTIDIEEARNILNRYNVEYVYIGSLENTYYWSEGLAKFNQMADAGVLAEVFNDGNARIFRVIQ